MTAQIASIMKYRYLLINLVSKDITVKYRKSILGLLWSVLNPILTMIVITIVFSTMFRFSIDNYPIYYLTGSIIFSFVSDSTNMAMGSILEAGGLIKKVYIPKYIFPLEKVIFGFVNLLFSLIAMLFIIPFFPIKITWNLLLIPVPLLCAFVFSFGIGLILSSAAVYFRDILHLYSVFLTLLMYMTPIFYPFDIIPESYKVFFQANPLYHYINYFRQIVLYGVTPTFFTHWICIMSAVIMLTIGIMVFDFARKNLVLYL